jgi:phage-related protein
MEKKVEFDWIRRKDDTSEFEDFVAGLPDKDAAKLLSVIHNIEEQGLLVAAKMQWVKKFDGGLAEVRSAQGGNIQRAIYFHDAGDRYLITHGFTKKTQKTPPGQLEHARDMMRRYMEGGRHEQD